MSLQLRWKSLIVVHFSFVFATLALIAPAHAQRVMEGPKTPSENVRTYKIGDERVRFVVKMVSGVDFAPDYLGRIAKDLAQEAQQRNFQTCIWDNKWYAYSIPNLNDRKKYLLVIAHNIDTDEIGWTAASFDGSRFQVMNNEGVTFVPWNGEKVRFLFELNGHRVEMSFYNPYEGGWNSNNLFCKIGESLDPAVRVRDEEGYKF